MRRRRSGAGGLGGLGGLGRVEGPGGLEGLGGVEDVRPLIAGTLVLVTVVILDATPGLILVGYFGLGPLIIAAASPPRVTAAVGALAVIAALLSGFWDHWFGTGPHLAATTLVALQSVIAVCICVCRERQRSQLHQVKAVA